MLPRQFTQSRQHIRRESYSDMLIFCRRIHTTIIALLPLYIKRAGRGFIACLKVGTSATFLLWSIALLLRVIVYVHSNHSSYHT